MPLTVPLWVLNVTFAVALLVGCGSDSRSTPDTPSQDVSPSPSPSATTSSFLLAARVPSLAVWSAVQSVFKTGDFALVPVNTTVASSIAVAQQIATDYPGIHIVFFDRPGGLNSVSTIDAYLAQNSLPPEIDYVAYDFEPTYQSEFTFDETMAIQLFAQAKSIAATHGKKVYPTPFNPFRSEAVTQAVGHGPCRAGQCGRHGRPVTTDFDAGVGHLSNRAAEEPSTRKKALQLQNSICRALFRPSSFRRHK